MAKLAAGRAVRCAWTNEIGGLTFAVGDYHPERFIKWTPRTSGEDLTGEAQRLRWAGAYVAVPRVVDCGSDDEGYWLMTEAITAENAVSERWKDNPAAAVEAIGRGLRTLHDTLPVEHCPFSWSATERVADARRRADLGLIDPRDWHHEHRALTVTDALELIQRPPDVDRLVVCQGDACAPNTLIAHNGQVAGHIDLGALGVADCWADLAVATWSATWNYGPGWEAALLDAYGIEPDPPRSSYYRLLWDLGPTGPRAAIAPTKSPGR